MTRAGALNSSAPACAVSGATHCAYLSKKTQPRVSPTTSPMLPSTYLQRFPNHTMELMVAWVNPLQQSDIDAMLVEEGCLAMVWM